MISNLRFAVAGLVVSVMLLAGAGAASAEDWCVKHVAHAQRDLDRAIDHHGYYSSQAEHARRELARVRNECRYR